MLNQLRFLHRASVFIHNNAKNYSKKVMPVRGMTDLYGTEIIKHNFIIDNSKQIAKAYGFQEISFLFIMFFFNYFNSYFSLSLTLFFNLHLNSNS